MELLIMAAGMGSRFGGLKQIEPMGPNGEFIIDYSIYNAVKAGFSKVIFIIKKENLEAFKETIGARVEKHIPVEYVFQEIDNVPSFVNIPKSRIKPWGTAHAIYSAKDAIKEPFVVINADDYYGQDAFLKAKEFLINNNNDHLFATIAYHAINTITENGAVKRGIISINQDNNLLSILESKLTIESDNLKCEPLNGKPAFIVSNDKLVSMNMLALYPCIFNYLEKEIIEFFEKKQNDLNDCEIFLPDILTKAIKEKFAEVRVIPTTSKWYGVTYKEDKILVKDALLKMHRDGKYPKELWKNNY